MKKLPAFFLFFICVSAFGDGIRCNYRNTDEWLAVSRAHLAAFSGLQDFSLAGPVKKVWNKDLGPATDEKIFDANFQYGAERTDYINRYSWMNVFYRSEDKITSDPRLLNLVAKGAPQLAIAPIHQIAASASYLIVIDPQFVESVRTIRPDLFEDFASWVLGHEIGHLTETIRRFNKGLDPTDQDHFIVDGIGAELSGVRPKRILEIIKMLVNSFSDFPETDIKDREECLSKISAR